MKSKSLKKTQTTKIQRKRMEKDESGKSTECDENDHVGRKSKSEGSFCELCKKKLRSRYHLKLHMAVHTGEKNYICGICQKGYQQKWNLITHVARVHSKEKPFKCNDCGKAFGYSSHFKRHVKTHFLEKIEAPELVKKRILNPYKCELCEKSFESNYRLDVHMRVHTGTRPYICEKCGKSFTTRRLCSVHMKKKHNSNSDFKCDHCGANFPDRSAIVVHLESEHKPGNILEKQTPDFSVKRIENANQQAKKEIIPCEVCGKGITRASVRKHLNIHYRNRLYTCRYCQKQFLESGQRMVHERKHTGEKPYLCDICGRGHTQYGNLLTHRKRYHNLLGKTPKLWKRNSTLLLDNNVLAEPFGNFLQDQTKLLVDVTTSLRNAQASITPVTSNQIVRNDLRTNLNGSNDHINAGIFKTEMENDTKPKYTGNETIEQFLKIASTWVNKKFQESKHRTVKSTKKDSLVEATDSSPVQTRKKFSEEIDHLSDIADTTTELDLSNTSNQQTNTKQKNPSKSENDKEEKKKKFMNDVKEVKWKINRIIFEKIVENLQTGPEKNAVSLVVEKINNKAKHKEMDVLREFLKMMKNVPENSMMRMTDGKLFWHCWMCESKLRSRHLLARHLLIHEPEENRPYRCDICRKTFTQSNNFKEHIMSHYNENQFCCEKCGSGFRHKSHFNIHMRRHLNTADPPARKYECSYCDKKLNTNYQKLEHERTHTKEKPFLCKVCGQQFGALSTLNRHQSTHGNARHQCMICLKLFRQKSSLKRHYGTHSEYPFNRVGCECGKTFSQSPSLKKHKMICKNRVEPVIKPFECLVCSKRFLTKSDLNRHLATHDSSKRYKCPICLTGLKTEETFKRHLRRHEESQNESESFIKRTQ